MCVGGGGIEKVKTKLNNTCGSIGRTGELIDGNLRYTFSQTHIHTLLYVYNLEIVPWLRSIAIYVFSIFSIKNHPENVRIRFCNMTLLDGFFLREPRLWLEIYYLDNDNRVPNTKGCRGKKSSPGFRVLRELHPKHPGGGEGMLFD